MSRPRGASVSADRPEMSVQLDYSNIYRENEELDEHLEDQLDDLHKNQYRTWVEKRQQLKMIRKQVEVIMRLRAAVNARKPGDSIEIVTNSRPRRPSRAISGRPLKPKADDSKDIDPMDVAEMAQTSKTQMRISMEREKYSSKNLFNVRRKNRGLGGSVFDNSHSTNNINSNNHTTSNTAQTAFSIEGTGGKLFTKRESMATHRVSEMNGGGATHYEDDYSNPGNINTQDKRSIIRPSSERPYTAHTRKSNKAYMLETVSSRKGNRPKTAMGIPSEMDLGTGAESAPASRRPSANRCRSRRELELLSRLDLKDDQKEKEKEDDGTPAWDVIKESRRNNKLDQLRSQGKELKLRVDKFLNDLQHFNTDRKNSSNSNSADRHMNKILYE